MEKEIFDSMTESMLSPVDFITLMFERTDEDGILYIPGWGYTHPGWAVNAPGSTDSDFSYRCRIEWNIDRYEKVQKKFDKIYNGIKALAPMYDALYEAPESAYEIINNKDLFSIWETYLSDLDTGNFDLNKCDEIYDKLDTVAEVKSIAEAVARGDAISNFEKEILTDNIDITVSQEELKYRRDYLAHLHKEAELRLGNNICAYDILYRAWRLWRLFSLEAPNIIIFHEGRELAAAFVLHEYGISKELVDNTVRLRIEQMENMTDEELDELFRPQKSNTRKSLAPLFVYDILMKCSDSKRHLRQNEILLALSKYPYEISLERKALSRIIHNLADSSQYAVFQDRSGVWIDQEIKQKY
ncbi:MAG: hypothetical protein IKM06_07285 [Clostridia bacterium]|nr:hypothetical protein [Clostridia bacterium]